MYQLHLFSLFIQFSAIEIRLVFSQAKLTCMIKWLKWLEKRWDAHARWWAIAIFQLTELDIKANPPCFPAHARRHAKWHHKLCTERMRKRKSTTVGKTHYDWVTEGTERYLHIWVHVFNFGCEGSTMNQPTGAMFSRINTKTCFRGRVVSCIQKPYGALLLLWCVTSNNTPHYTCHLSRIMRESHACGSKIVISRVQTNFSRLTDNSECNCLKTN